VAAPSTSPRGFSGHGRYCERPLGLTVVTYGPRFEMAGLGLHLCCRILQEGGSPICGGLWLGFVDRDLAGTHMPRRQSRPVWCW